MVLQQLQNPPTGSAAAAELETFGVLRGKANHKLGEVVDIVERESRNLHDFTTETRKLHLAESPCTDLVLNNGAKQVTMGPRAFGDLCGRVRTRDGCRLPAQYLLSCPPDMRAKQVNYWLKQNGDKGIMLRCNNNRVRAVLSERYRVMDNLPLVQALAKTINAQADVRYCITDERLHIQAVSSKRDVTPPSALRKLGDISKVGLYISNSEIGAGALNVASLIYRLACLNGLITTSRGAGCKEIHLGRNDFDFRGILQTTIPAVLDSAETTLKAFQRTPNVPLEVKPREAIRNVTDRFRLTGDDNERINEAFRIEPGERVYDIINAATRASNGDNLPLDRRVRLQDVGGRMVAMKNYKWLNLEPSVN